MDQTSLYSALLHVHSVGRWVVLLLLLFAILNSLIAGNRPYIRTDNRLGLLLTIAADIMLLVGAYLWWANPRWGYVSFRSGTGIGKMDEISRFFAVEHLAGMLIAIVLIHIGKAQGRKRIADRAKHRRTLIFYLLALLIILASIPWPFLTKGAYSHWY